MGWVAQEPLSVERRRAMIEGWENEWQQGGDVVLGVFLGENVAGGCGLHHRTGVHGLEIGYWTHPLFVRRGIATRASALLTAAAFAMSEIADVEIHHDKANRASAGIPPKLGYRFVAEVPDRPEAPGEIGIECQWRLARAEWEAAHL
jgi:RimJ/RimL family protein N-acetyltransferase